MDLKTVDSRNSQKWTREEVLDLLCTLNLHMGDVIDRVDELRADWRIEGVKIARKLVCSNMKTQRAGEPSQKKQERIERKLASLWKAWGRSSDDEESNLLYLCGAYTVTLPLLENPKTGFLGMFNEIAERVSNEQRRLKMRRSERNKTENDEPIECTCRFTHTGPSVRCKNCKTWQHTLCIYGITTHDDEIIPEEYICENCRDEPAADIGGTADSMAGVPGHDFSHFDCCNRDIDNSSSLTGDFQAFSISDRFTEYGPFSNERDGGLFWGLTPEAINSRMKSVMYGIQNVVFSILQAGLNARKIRKTIEDVKDRDVGNVIRCSLGDNIFEQLLVLISHPKPSLPRIARLLTGMISSMAIELVIYPRQLASLSVEPMLYEMLLRNILDTNGPDAVRQLRTKSLLRLVTGREERFLNTAEQGVENITYQMMELLLNMMPTVRSVDVHLAKSRSANALRDKLKTILTKVLEIKVRLVISERFYEFRTLPAGTRPSTELTLDDIQETVTPDQTVEVCLLPAVIELDPADRGKTLDEMIILPTDEIFICDIPPEKGRVVSPAIVALRH